jgi:hypothetical protein
MENRQHQQVLDKNLDQKVGILHSGLKVVDTFDVNKK